MPDGPPIRIGHAEREAAYAALNTHLDAGRIDVEEYAERYAQASMARTRAELEVLFLDLPEPHAFTPPPPPMPSRLSQASARVSGVGTWTVRIAIAVAVIIAAIVTDGAAFLIIPLAIVFMSGRHGRRGHWGGPHGRPGPRGPGRRGAW